jgi:hypothetical protein
MIERCLIERRLIVIRRAAQFNPGKLQAEPGSCAPRCLPLVGRQCIPKHSRGWPIRKAILNELDPLCCQFDLLEDYAGNVAGGPRQACDVATRKRIVVNGNHYDRQRPRNGERRLQADFWANGKNDVERASHELSVEDFVLVCAHSLQKIKGEILAFLITELSHAPLKSYPLR